MNYLSNNIITILLLIFAFFLIIIVFQDYSFKKRESFNDIINNVKLTNAFKIFHRPINNTLPATATEQERIIEKSNNINESIKYNQLSASLVDKISTLHEDQTDFLETKLNHYEQENDSVDYYRFNDFYTDIINNPEDIDVNPVITESFYGIYKIYNTYKDLQDFFIYYGEDNTGHKRFSILNGFNQEDIQFTFLINEEEVQTQMPSDTIKIELIKIPDSQYEYTTDNEKSNKAKKILKALGVNLNGGVFYLRKYHPESNAHSIYNEFKKAIFHMTKVEDNKSITTSSTSLL